MPTEEQIMKMKWNAKKGWIVEVDLEYPEELHDVHNDYRWRQRKERQSLGKCLNTSGG